jgi:hypothetical protein
MGMVSPRQINFAKRVEILVREDGLSYMQAITYVVDELSIEPETVNRYIDDGLKDRIAKCCAKNKTIKNHGEFEEPPKLYE